MSSHQLVIRGGTIVDGTGGEPFSGDVAVDDGIIVAVGDVDGAGRREIDADGALVMPGVVDIHSHFDGQVTWDPLLTPTCWHGVTTVVMGNCGVGFAPVAPDRREWLVGLMEGVEDIPGTAMHEGMTWAWETFPEYLDHLESLPLGLDVGTQVPHGAVRAYVMGEAGARNEPASPAEIEAMAAIVREGIEAGALGFSMSRTVVHRAIDGEPVPGTFAATDEVLGIGRVLGELGTGVVELAPAGVVGEDLSAPDREMQWMRQLAGETGRPVSYAMVQHDADPTAWRRAMELASQARVEGLRLYPQVHGRSVCVLIGLDNKTNPLQVCPSWRQVADLPLGERARSIRGDLELRARLVAELETHRSEWPVSAPWSKIYPLGVDTPDYEPDASMSIEAMAERTGSSVYEVVVDELTRGDGSAFLNLPILNFSDGNHDPVKEMIEHPASVLGLSDGGAHCNAICDASVPSWMLAYWCRDRLRGTMAVPWVVKKMTRDTAEVYGLNDRGLLETGYRGDVAVVDFDHLRVLPPKLAHDLPGGVSRLVQEAEGWLATVVAGEVLTENGAHTGSYPGRLIRGERPDPSCRPADV